MAQVVTFDSADICVQARNGDSNHLEGICVDIWRRLAEDLNINYTMITKSNWTQMMDHAKNEKSDVIIHAMNDGMLSYLAMDK